LTILEIQQPSDLTYRFYDWDRPDRDGSMRELHVDKALQVLRCSGPGAPLDAPRREGARQRLVNSERFTLDRLRGRFDARGALAEGPWLVFTTRGAASLAAAGFEESDLEAGQSWLIPAGIEDWHMHSSSDETEVFVAAAGAVSVRS
jgi:mannose-6-phosphate isomerase